MKCKVCNLIIEEKAIKENDGIVFEIDEKRNHSMGDSVKIYDIKTGNQKYIKRFICWLFRRHNEKNIYQGNKILPGNPSWSICRYCGSKYRFENGEKLMPI